MGAEATYIHWATTTAGQPQNKTKQKKDTYKTAGAIDLSRSNYYWLAREKSAKDL